MIRTHPTKRHKHDAMQKVDYTAHEISICCRHGNTRPHFSLNSSQ